jgi:hypothetical protein
MLPNAGMLLPLGVAALVVRSAIFVVDAATSKTPPPRRPTCDPTPKPPPTIGVVSEITPEQKPPRVFGHGRNLLDEQRTWAGRQSPPVRAEAPQPEADARGGASALSIDEAFGAWFADCIEVTGRGADRIGLADCATNYAEYCMQREYPTLGKNEEGGKRFIAKIKQYAFANSLLVQAEVIGAKFRC